jgi:hypothetical protein
MSDQERGPWSEVTNSLPVEQRFRARRATKWFAVTILVRTGLQVGLSSLFARFADKREQQGAIPSAPVDFTAPADGVWIDYVCDSGDGFPATATIAHLVAQPELDVGGHRTRRGQILLLGGDQVYPFADIQDYKDRLIGPFAAMLPEPEPEVREDDVERRGLPIVLSVPGNHDWYDGLTAFRRLFTRPSPTSNRKPMAGGWRVEQQRSYFAVKLQPGWWLWGIDIQLDTYIDDEQLAWFTDEVCPDVQEGDAVILCSAKPSWIESGPDKPDGFDNLDYFERKIIDPKARLRVALTGDHHYYARYECTEGDRRGEQKLIVGGGGAYLAATHHLPERVPLPPEQSGMFDAARVRTYERRIAYPDPDTSRAERKGIGRIGFVNGRVFPLVVGLFYALWAYTLVARRDPAEHLLDLLRRAFVPWAPVLVLLGVVALLIGFTHEKRKPKKRLARGFALLHVVLHLLAVVLLAWPVEWFVAEHVDGGLAWPARFLVAFVVGVAGALVGPLVLGLYLLLADRGEINTNELYAGQHIQDYKCFVRLHLAPDGSLTLYPIKVDHVVHEWHRGDVDGSPSLIHPDRPIEYALIEDPIVVARVPAPLTPATGATG